MDGWKKERMDKVVKEWIENLQMNLENWMDR